MPTKREIRDCNSKYHPGCRKCEKREAVRPATDLRKNPDSDHWKFVEETAERVEGMPKWKQNAIVAHEFVQGPWTGWTARVKVATDAGTREIECPTCGGHGIDPESAGNHCDECFGRGTVTATDAGTEPPRFYDWAKRHGFGRYEPDGDGWGWDFTASDEAKKAYDELLAARSSVESPDGDVILHYGKTPCGHSEQFLWTEDGGKHIVCLVCEFKRPVESEWIAQVKEFLRRYSEEYYCGHSRPRKTCLVCLGKKLASESATKEK